MIANVGGIVLAGGNSTRMGQDKARIPFGMGTLLEHTVSVLRQVTEEIIVVAETADKYAVAGCSVVGDRFPGQGPVGGMITGLQDFAEREQNIRACLVVACDMPHLNASLLARFALMLSTDEDAVVPLSPQGIEPLCACYRLSALPKLQAFFERGGRSVRKALEALTLQLAEEAAWQDVDPQGLTFTNWNTPKDRGDDKQR